jgi:hypothetical protein
MRALTLKAGPRALQHLRERGLRAADIDVIPAASGGAKWLAIAGLDRMLFGQFFAEPRTSPLHLIGSSIGSWRMACLAQDQPLAALDRTHHAYIHDQEYTPKPSPRDVAVVLQRILDTMLGPTGVREILSQPAMRLHVITAQGRGLARSGRLAPLTGAMLLAGVLNAASRRTLGWQFTRTIFSPPDAPPPLGPLRDLPTRVVTLTAHNLRDALAASGSIPLVIDGVSVAPAHGGLHWDGGITDYHLNLPFAPTERLILFPHFYSHITPGWFDKSLPWRRENPAYFARALLLAPSAAFVATLPGGRIPDRRDFRLFTPAERIRRWEAVRRASVALGDELGDLLASGRLAESVGPWSVTVKST